MIELTSESSIEFVEYFSKLSNNRVDILREDTFHPQISGNKFRKLKYNLLDYENNDYDGLITFGGAYSNHISATAIAGKVNKIRTIGVIRGEELAKNLPLNQTLSFAVSCGMQLKFVSREDYKLRDTAHFLNKLSLEFPNYYILPEGGTNALAVRGCSEILTEAHTNYDYICVSVGTGGTMAGIVESATRKQKVIGFSALKGTFQKEFIEKYNKFSNFNLIDDYCFGGYAKVDRKLIEFMNDFKMHTGITLDPVYTGKMMYGIREMLKKEYFKKNSRILAVHTGGLQGIPGMNKKLTNKNLPLIDV